MKRLLALALSLVMSAALLAACGNDEESSNADTTTTTTPAVSDEATTTTPAEDETTTSEVEDNGGETAELTAQGALDHIVTIGQWGMGFESDFLASLVELDPTLDTNQYLLDMFSIDATKFEEVALGMSMITAQADTVLIIKADGNIDEAKSTVDAFRDLKIGSAWYPEESAVFEAAVTGTVDNFAYYIAHATDVAGTEAALKEYLGA